MSAATALKKISAEVKRLRKKHPNSKYKTLQKQAGKAYRDGKLKSVSGVKRKKATVKKRKASKRKVSAVGAVRVVYRAAPAKKRAKRRTTRKAAVKRMATRRRKVGGVMSGVKSLVMPVLLIGGALLAYELLKPKAAVPVLATRTTPAAAANQTSILQYAQAIGLTGTALAALINSLNSQSDNTVSQLNPASYVQNIQSTLPTSTISDPTATSGSITILNT